MYINFELEDFPFFFLINTRFSSTQLKCATPGSLFHSLLSSIAPKSEGQRMLQIPLTRHQPHVQPNSYDGALGCHALENDTRNITANHYHRIVGSFHGPKTKTGLYKIFWMNDLFLHWWKYRAPHKHRQWLLRVENAMGLMRQTSLLRIPMRRRGPKYHLPMVIHNQSCLISNADDIRESPYPTQCATVDHRKGLLVIPLPQP